MNKSKKKLLFRKKEILQNRPVFLERLSVLLTEGYTFHDAVTLLVPHHLKDYNPVLEAMNNDFKEGFGVTHILASFGFSSGTLLPIAIAEVDGRVAQALSGMAVRMRKAEEKRKKLKNLLIYPIVLFILIAALLMAFRRFFLPNMEALAISRKSEDGGFVSSLPSLVTKIPDFIIGMVVSLCITNSSMYCYLQKVCTCNKNSCINVHPCCGNILFDCKDPRLF